MIRLRIKQREIRAEEMGVVYKNEIFEVKTNPRKRISVSKVISYEELATPLGWSLQLPRSIGWEMVRCQWLWHLQGHTADSWDQSEMRCS